MRLAARVWLGVAAMVLSACAGGTADSDTPAADPNGSFSAGLPSNPDHLLPGRSGSSNFDYAIWTPPTVIDPESGELSNAVAESVESEDSRVWTIKLREGWTFHNGDPVTAQSFADSWNATAYGPNAFDNNSAFAMFKGYAEMNPAEGKPTAETLSGVKVVDELTLEVTLTEPSSMFPYQLASTTFAPIPEQALDDLDTFDKLPIGNGPFRLTGDGLAPGVQTVTLERYDDYAGEPARAKSVEVTFFKDSSALYTAFKAGDIDVTFVGDTDVADAKVSYPDRFTAFSFPALIYLGFPSWDERFDDSRVRQAFSLAVDREAIVTSLLRGSGEVASGVAPDVLEGGGGDECANCEYDPDEAKSLLEAAGGFDGKLTLWTYQEDAANVTVLEAIGNQLRTNLGIQDVELNPQPVAELYPALSEEKVDGPFLLYAGATYPHLYAMSSILFSATGWANTTKYDGEEAGRLLAEAAASSDDLLPLTEQATEVALADVPIAPLYHPGAGMVWSENVGNVVPEFLGGPHFAGITAR
ncbi:MAG: peptide ABC transporter substrate-binding protein [Nocardioides sp.]